MREKRTDCPSPSSSGVLFLSIPWSFVLHHSWKSECLCLCQLLLLLSSPILNCCLGRDWFLLLQGCREVMKYSLLCQSSLHHPQFHSFFFLIDCLTCTRFYAWYHDKGKEKSTRIWAPTLPRQSCIVTKQHGIWKTRETGQRRFFRAVMAISGR